MLSLVRAQVADAVIANTEPAIHADLIRLLSRPGYALHPRSSCRGGLLALETYRAVKRTSDPAALLAAAAVELLMQSASVFDDISDGQAGGSHAEDLALALALLTAGTATASEATSCSPDPVGAMRHFCVASGEACAGQFLDARLERRGSATADESLEMTRLKSGSLGRFAAGFAARLAGAEPEALDMFERFASDLFSFAQLVDDQRDARPPVGDSDLARSKATLPVVFYLRGASDAMLSRQTCDAYLSSGASTYTAIIALAYLARARAELRLLADRGYAIADLGRVLESVDSSAAETLGAVGPGVVA